MMTMTTMTTKEKHWDFSANMTANVLRVAALTLILFTFSVWGQRERCVCMMDQENWFFDFDLLKFKLPLPCTYRMTRVRTRTGCDMTVNLVISQSDDDTKAAGMTYSVRDGNGMASGVVSARGVGISDPQGFDTMFYPPSVMSMNGVEVFSYTDDLGFKSAYFPSCAISLHYQTDGYLGVYSRNSSDDYSFSAGFLCGDCDGENDAERMLGSSVTRRMRTWEDRTSAMLMLSALHIVGGDSQCIQHRDVLSRCHANTAYIANQVCGCILSPDSETGKCMRTKVSSRDRMSAYYACVQQYCGFGGSLRAGCNGIRDLLQTNGCPQPKSFYC